MMIVLRSFPAVTVGLILSGAATPAIAGQCASGWTGTIHYARSQSMKDSKTEQRVTGKGTEATNYSMTYDYGAQIAVRALPEAGLSGGRASISHNMISTETKSAKDIEICPHTQERRQVSGQFVRKSETRAQGSGLETDVHIGEDMDGTYTVSVILPELEGVVTGSSSASYGGQCTAKKGGTDRLPETPTKIDGVRFGTDGDDRLNPSDPDRLAGSFSKTWSGVTEKLSWNLRRCGPALRLVEVKFEDMRFPRWEDWQDIVEQNGTIDGNIVRVTAVVANDGAEEKAATIKFRETYKGDKWDGAKPDSTINELSVTVPAGEQREVKFNWDSSGYAWYDDGRPRLVQRIRAEVEDRGKKVDEQTRNLKVAPKPLVLVHGLWSNWRAWETWQNILTTSHSYDWKAFPVGEKPDQGRMNTGEEPGNFGPTYSIDQNAEQLGRYIEYAQKDRNAWHVDLVAHSMGGLISRRYIHATMPSYADGKPQVGHLVMLGTPNMGSQCADQISMTLDFLDKPMDALRELRPSEVEHFNAAHTERKGVAFSVLAGNILPAVCSMFTANDGVVSVPSATWTIADTMQMKVLHTDMTGTGPFSEFVKPRVAIGPQAQRKAGSGASSRLMLIDEGAPAAAAGKPDFSKLVTLAPGQAMDVSLPVEEARNLGLTFLAANSVSATLTDDKGAVAGTNLSGAPEASQLFRTIFVDRPIAKGSWTVTLHNKSEVKREVILSSWSTR